MPTIKLPSPQEVHKRYKDLGDRLKKEPYFYQISKGNQHLYYLGTDHSFDPSHPHIAYIKKYWQKFLQDSKGKRCIVLVEGGSRPVAKDEETAIRENGEPGLATYLATQ